MTNDQYQDTVYVAEYSEGIDTMARYAADTLEYAFELAAQETRGDVSPDLDTLEHRGASYDTLNIWIYPHTEWNDDVIYEPGITIRELPIYEDPEQEP